MLLEICASTYQSAINAQKGQADRIELCENLSIGGVTPSKKLIKDVVETLKIPVFVLIRPRAGDFVYSEEEFNQMKADIEFCKSIDCKGIVSGVLLSDNSLDIERTKVLIELSKPLPFTFHRAFDQVKNPKETLQQLINLGCSRILTSGQQPTAHEGLLVLNHLRHLANNRLEILVGGSVRSSNAFQFKQAGFNEIHSSALVSGNDSNLEEIKKIIELIKSD